MSNEALVYFTSDAPSEASVLAIDAGLERHNQSVAPLAEVKPLASFASEPSGQIIGGGAANSSSCHGYISLAEISGYPNGITKYLMHKTSDPAAARPDITAQIR